MRDLNKAISEGRQLREGHDSIDMTVEEMKYFYNRLDDSHDWFNVLSDCFSFGVAIGARIQRKEVQ